MPVLTLVLELVLVLVHGACARARRLQYVEWLTEQRGATRHDMARNDTTEDNATQN